MRTHFLDLRQRVILCLVLLSTTTPVSAEDSVNETLLLLRPHCAEYQVGSTDILGPLPDASEFVRLGSGRCPNFPVRDPRTQATNLQDVDDTLAMDLIVFNPNHKKIHSVRAWLSYDPAYLEGKEIVIDPAFPAVTPGEADFNAEQGNIQIGVATEDGDEVSDLVVKVAEIRLRVKDVPPDGSTPLVFQDLQVSLDGHTYVSALEGTEQRNILPTELGTLLVLVRNNQQASSSSSIASSSSAASSIASSAASSAASSRERTSFVLLQIQNLRATTDKGGSTIYTAWDHLNSADLAGYNLYYGTERGRYIQRHSIEKDANSYAIRGLVPGTTYYLAVRGFNSNNEETAFSHEVAITVGNPASSTSPLVGRPSDAGPKGQNPVDKPGSDGSVPESGLPSSLALFLLAAGIIGTGFAFRRQLAASPVSSRP